jgi:hypothetical protein
MIPGMMGRKHKQGLGGVLGFIKSMYLGDNPLLVNQHVGLFVWQPHGGSLAPLLHEQTWILARVSSLVYNLRPLMK